MRSGSVWFLGSEEYSDRDKTGGIRVTDLASITGNSSWEIEKE